VFGVGQVVACLANSPPDPNFPVESIPDIPWGVSQFGEDEHALSPVASAALFRTEYSRLCSVTQALQFSEDMEQNRSAGRVRPAFSFEPLRDNCLDVFEEDECRSHPFDAVPNVWPKVPWISISLLLSCTTERLAGEPR
jgi:hypothetical protein